MEVDKIRELLEKYWAGETTLEEEDELQSYFASSQVADDLMVYQPLFSFFGQSKLVSMQKKIEVPEEISEPKIRSLRWLTNIAAAILVLLGVYLFSEYQKNKSMETYVMTDTYEDPELAYEEVKQALLYLSVKMNKGVSQANQSLEKIKPLDNILN